MGVARPQFFDPPPSIFILVLNFKHLTHSYKHSNKHCVNTAQGYQLFTQCLGVHNE
jgi:hypothetical protein